MSPDWLNPSLHVTWTVSPSFTGSSGGVSMSCHDATLFWYCGNAVHSEENLVLEDVFVYILFSNCGIRFLTPAEGVVTSLLIMYLQ